MVAQSFLLLVIVNLIYMILDYTGHNDFNLKYFACIWLKIKISKKKTSKSYSSKMISHNTFWRQL